MLCLYHFNSSFFKWNTFLNYNYSNVITSKRSFWPLNIHFPSFWSNNWSNFLIIAKTSNQDSITDWIRNFLIPLETIFKPFSVEIDPALVKIGSFGTQIGHRNLTLVTNIKHPHLPSPTSIFTNLRPRQW